MEDDFSLDDLFSELEDVQQEEKRNFHTFKIASESVPDLMKLMIDQGMFGDEKMYFTGKKEYVLRGHLRSEIEKKVNSLGRVTLYGLKQLLVVDESIIESLLPEISVIIRNGEVFSEEYLDQLADEIYELLDIKGSCTIQHLCDLYQFSLSFFNDFFFPNKLFNENKQISMRIIRRKNFLYTSKYLKRLESTLKGYFTSIISPIRIDSSEFLFGLFSTNDESQKDDLPQVSSAQCIKIVQKLLKSGRLSGRFLGETFFPKLFDDQIRVNITSFLNQNVCMSYHYILENFLPFGTEKELKRYLKKNVLKGQLLKKKYEYFQKCVAYSELIDIKISVQIQEAIQDRKCVNMVQSNDWLKHFTEEEKEDLYDRIFGYDDDDDEDEGSNRSKYVSQVKMIEDVLVPVVLIHENFFNEECRKRTEKKFRKMIKNKLPVSRLKIDGRDLQASLVGWACEEGGGGGKDFFLGEVKTRIVHPYLEHLFKKFKEEDSSIGGQYGDLERKRKLTIKKVEENISRTFFELNLYVQGLETLRSKKRHHEEGINIGDDDNDDDDDDDRNINDHDHNSRTKKLLQQLDSYLLQTLRRQILEEIRELKLLEYRITNRKLPEEEHKVLTRLKFVKPASKFLETLKEKCVVLNVYLSPFTKRNRKNEAREKREGVYSQVEKLFSSLKSLEDSCDLESEEKEVLESLPLMMNYLMLKLMNHNCFVFMHGRHVREMLKLYIGDLLVKGGKEDVKEKFGMCLELSQKYLVKKKENVTPDTSSPHSNSRKRKKDRRKGVGKMDMKKKDQWGKGKGKKKKKKRKGKKKWMDESDEEEEENLFFKNREENENMDRKKKIEEEVEGEGTDEGLKKEIDELREEMNDLKELILRKVK